VSFVLGLEAELQAVVPIVSTGSRVRAGPLALVRGSGPFFFGKFGSLLGLDLQHFAWASADYGHRYDGAVFPEQLGHAELLA
jgi:hypothetical protein